MNERILKLAEQAGYGRDRWNTTEQFEQFMEKFVEVIVAECVSILSNVPPGYQDYRSQIEESMRDYCVQTILNEFDIK